MSVPSSSPGQGRDLPADMADWSGPELLEAYGRRQVSPVEVARAVIARIEAYEPRLQALYAYDPDAALRAARASEERWMRGEPRPLDGIPATIKENIATKGTPVPLGTAARPLVPAAEDAPPAARLREDGAVILAKTTMPDYGMLSSGLSSFHPLTRNPWDLSKNPGGSSAGRRGGSGGRLRAVPHRHRYRRLDPPAGRLVRRVRTQTQLRPHPHRPDLLRARGGPDGAERARRRPDDAKPVAARLARPHEPAAPGSALARSGHRASGV